MKTAFFTGGVRVRVTMIPVFIQMRQQVQKNVTKQTANGKAEKSFQTRVTFLGSVKWYNQHNSNRSNPNQCSCSKGTQPNCPAWLIEVKMVSSYFCVTAVPLVT